MLLGTIVDPGYKIALFLHILAVVLAFGPTFGYGFFFSVAPQHPKATPAILAGIQKVDKYLVNPGMIVLLLAGIGLLSASDGVWDGSDASWSSASLRSTPCSVSSMGSSSHRLVRRRSWLNAIWR